MNAIYTIVTLIVIASCITQLISADLCGYLINTVIFCFICLYIFNVFSNSNFSFDAPVNIDFGVIDEYEKDFTIRQHALFDNILKKEQQKDENNKIE